MRMRLISRLTLIALTLLFVIAGNAFGQIDPNIPYRIVAKHSNKCLAVADGINPRDNGNPVIQRTCVEGETNQMWKFISVRGYDGYYRIIAQHSLKALDVFGGIFSTGNGVRVDQWAPDLETDNQVWRVDCLGDGVYQFIAKHSRKALDINGGPTAVGDGLYAQQWDNWYGENQKFRLQPLFPGISIGRDTPAACPSEAESRIAIYAVEGTSFRRRADFRLNETILLRVENNTGASIFFKQEWRALGLIREEGLQVERRNVTSQNVTRWFSVLGSGICPAVLTENADGTVTGVPSSNSDPLTRLMELRATMNITRSWTTPVALGPGTYRLTLAYSRSRDIRMPSVVCSSPFAVGVPR